MGKRKRRLHSPKYAKKYASVRETYNRLRQVTKEALEDGVITPEEEEKIEALKQEVVQAAVESTVDVVKTVVSEVVEKTEEVVEKTKKVVDNTKKKAPAKRQTKRRTTSKSKSKG